MIAEGHTLPVAVVGADSPVRNGWVLDALSSPTRPVSPAVSRATGFWGTPGCAGKRVPDCSDRGGYSPHPASAARPGTTARTHPPGECLTQGGLMQRPSKGLRLRDNIQANAKDTLRRANNGSIPAVAGTSSARASGYRPLCAGPTGRERNSRKLQGRSSERRFYFFFERTFDRFGEGFPARKPRFGRRSPENGRRKLLRSRESGMGQDDRARLAVQPALIRGTGHVVETALEGPDRIHLAAAVG